MALFEKIQPVVLGEVVFVYGWMIKEQQEELQFLAFSTCLDFDAEEKSQR